MGAQRINASQRAALERRIAAVVARRGATGAQYALLRDGLLLAEHCIGLADVARARPVTPETTFNAYSIAKPLTATTVLALAQAGRVDLDAPMGTEAAIDGLGAFGSVRDTLLHRAGFPNPNPLAWIHPAEAHDRFDEGAFVRTQAARLAGARRRRAGSAYSNLGYMMLGLAIERAARSSFTDAVQAHVLGRLRLRPDERLGFAITQPAHHAHGHLRRLGLLDLASSLFLDRRMIVQQVVGRWVQLRHHQVNGSAYGGLIANARGLARFGQAIIGGDADMHPGVRRNLLTVVPATRPPRTLGFYAGDLATHRWLAHAGGGLGAYGELRVYPGLRAVSVLLTNGPGFRDARSLDTIDPAWLET